MYILCVNTKGKNSQLNSILLEGEVGSGKTSIAAWAAV